MTTMVTDGDGRSSCRSEGIFEFFFERAEGNARRADLFSPRSKVLTSNDCARSAFPQVRGFLGGLPGRCTGYWQAVAGSYPRGHRSRV
jgi:hypothetical protein